MNKCQVKQIAIILAITIICTFSTHQLWLHATSRKQNQGSQPIVQPADFTTNRALKISETGKNATALAVETADNVAKQCDSKVEEAMKMAESVLRVEMEDQIRGIRAEYEKQMAEAASHGTCEEQQEKTARKSKDSLARAVLEADIRSLRAFLGKYNASLTAEWEAALETQPKRGILMVAGPQTYSMNAFVSLWAVRKHFKSNLPVTIMWVVHIVL